MADATASIKKYGQLPSYFIYYDMTMDLFQNIIEFGYNDFWLPITMCFCPLAVAVAF